MSCMSLRRPGRIPSRQSRLGICLGFFLALLCVMGPPAAAQSSSGGPSILIAAEISVPQSAVTRMPVVVNAPRGLPPGAMLVFRGLPERVMLSEGRKFNQGVWAVPVASVGRLEIAPSSEANGTTEIDVELTTLDGNVLATAHTILSIGEQATEQTKTVVATARDTSIVRTTGTINSATPPAETAQPSASAVARRLSADEADRARKLMRRGDEALEGGKVTAARLLYQAAADAGWAPGAFALAQTYDNRALSQSKVLSGVQPDPALAKKWYEKAKELGSTEAAAHLQAFR
jgi:hypothetical protein